MEINDRGLGALIYHLMLGQVDERFFPGLNLLVRDESEPGGVCHPYRQEQRRLTERFRAKADEEQLQLLTLILMSYQDMFQAMAQVIFRYGLQLAPLLQKAPDGPEDELQDWNRFWSMDIDNMDPEKEAEIGREVLRTVGGMTGLLDLLTMDEAQDEQERARLRKQQSEAIEELFSTLPPDQLPDQEEVRRGKGNLESFLQMFGLLSAIRQDERAAKNIPDFSK